MSASHWQGVDRAPLRIGLAALTAAFVVLELASLLGLSADAHYRPTRQPWLPATPVTLALIGAVALAALGALAANRRPLLASAVALAAMGLVSLWGTQYFGMVSHNFMFPGGLLFGWALGLVYARTRCPRGAPDRALSEELAEAGAMGVFAALYVSSAASKLIDSGADWLSPNTLRVLVLSQRGLADLGWIDRYRSLLIDHPGLARLGAALTLTIEGGSFFLLVSRRTRTLWGALILLLHLNIIVIATMPYIEPMSFALVFALPWPALLRLPRAQPPTPTDGPTLSWTVIYGLLVLTLLGALLPVGASPFLPRPH